MRPYLSRGVVEGVGLPSSEIPSTYVPMPVTLVPYTHLLRTILPPLPVVTYQRGLEVQADAFVLKRRLRNYPLYRTQCWVLKFL